MRGFTQLEHRLDGALTRRLTTVVAAAGYGKTTLLEHWAEEAGGCIHRLRPGDRDPARLATAVVSALRLRPRRHRLPTISAMTSNSRRVLAIVAIAAALGAGVAAGPAVGGPLDVDPDSALDVDWRDQPRLWADH